jgi:hypothetical protein
LNGHGVAEQGQQRGRLHAVRHDPQPTAVANPRPQSGQAGGILHDAIARQHHLVVSREALRPGREKIGRQDAARGLEIEG